MGQRTQARGSKHKAHLPSILLSFLRFGYTASELCIVENKGVDGAGDPDQARHGEDRPGYFDEKRLSSTTPLAFTVKQEVSYRDDRQLDQLDYELKFVVASDLVSVDLLAYLRAEWHLFF